LDTETTDALQPSTPDYAPAAAVPTSPPARQAPLRDILFYSTGDGAASIVMNTIFGFSMMYYTKALGLDTALAGIAMAVAVVWDAIVDPFMGHISDNTRSRFGRRHPYMLLGGIMTVVCSYAIWAVPSFFQTPHLLFWYLVGINLLLRAGAAVFLVPHGALGFEICTDYNQRSTLQGIRNGFNMAVNLGASLLVWNVFLRNRGGIDGTTIPANYQRMGFAFALVALVFVLIVVFATRKYIVDTRGNPEIAGNSFDAIARNLRDILFDPYPRTVFVFMAVLFISIVLVTSLQMFIYVDFMKFAKWEASVVHCSTMVCAALGALSSALLVRRFDKKPSIFIAILASSVGNIMLLVLFYTGWVRVGLAWGPIPVAMLVFMAFHGVYHFSTNAATAIANSMMADVSEISHHRTGILKDGGYSAMMLFVFKMGIALGLLLCGYCMKWIGYNPQAPQNDPGAIRNLMPMAFLGGTVVALIAVISMARYPVNRAYMAKIRAEIEAGRPPAV
jgi:glycoside/pentoside/hexuronide:cation symporter, GPH family